MPRAMMQENMPSKGSMELVAPMEGMVYVSCTMKEAREVDTAAKPRTRAGF